MEDKKNITPRGRTFRGIVVSAKMQKTATVQWTRLKYIPKYERYMMKKAKVKAHNPEEINAQEGDEVIIKECRPLSKTKTFIITKKLESNKK
ncbi:30S ribosomal protein S17 [Candidatus Woesearchaeota archaeon]|nr:30S ribosomal protein S17 [Candidatus Woesearchaeota archaeon]